MTQGEHDKFHIGIGDEPSHAATAVSHKDEEHVKNGSRQRNSFSVANGERITRENGTEHGHEIAPSQMNMKEIAIKVAKKMLRLPLTYATVMGIVYSLIAGRWGFDPPRILRNSLDIMGRITLGLTMYSIDSEDGGSNYVEVEATEAITVVPEIDGDEFGVKNFTISTTQDTSTSKDDKDLDTKSKLNVKERQQEAV
ncbi:auxin efflux carrier component 4-like [Physcomitrium patens]|uniref:auxin efflux carrier component 4-like n=1 Tax=Physcomitrium patens TaxID=3218 RepID=UPI003CCD7418